ncbi:MAG TPA: 3-hydroxyacyl-ACP dehydratase FabZ [Fimbriimonadales bacterium]|nr:3-hydroxyacyl-ACP dehydratase FabZ [Fimbriimonadales bacterium]
MGELEGMDTVEIQQILPHRYPFLLVDRMEELEVGKKGRGYKNLTINELFFQGHYPGMPIMPGVLIIEAMAQVGALVLLSDPKFEGVRPLVAGLDNVRFRRRVVPGDRLITTAEVVWFRKGIGCMKGTATVDGELAAEADITFKIVYAEEAR